MQCTRCKKSAIMKPGITATSIPMYVNKLRRMLSRVETSEIFFSRNVEDFNVKTLPYAVDHSLFIGSF